MHATMTQVDVGFMTAAGHTTSTSPRHLRSWITAPYSLGMGGGNSGATSISVSAETGESEVEVGSDSFLPRTTNGSHYQLLYQGEGGVPIGSTPTPSFRSINTNRRRDISHLMHQHPSTSPSMSDVASESDLRSYAHRRCSSEKINDILLEESNEESTTIRSACEDELEEVSLDPKWAAALREISIRLASERAQQSMTTAKSMSEPSVGPVVVQSDSPVDVKAFEARERSPLPTNRTTPSIPILTDLQRMIQEATKSIGKFSLETMESNANDDGDNISLSSFASDAHFVAKNFAESKKHIPRRGSLRSHQLDDHAPWTQGFEFYPKQKYFGSTGTGAQHEENIFGSGSSVTSSLTCESYNSLVSPPKSSRGSSPTKTASAPYIHHESADSEVSIELGVVPTSDRNVASALGPSLVANRMNKTRVEDSFSCTKKTTRQSSFKKGESAIGRRTARSSSPVQDDIMLEAPRQSLLSFLTALGRNSRSRSLSRPQKSQSRSKSRARSKSQSRSKSRTRNRKKVAAEPTDTWKSNIEMDDQRMCEHEYCTPPEMSVLQQAGQKVGEPNTEKDDQSIVCEQESCIPPEISAPQDAGQRVEEPPTSQTLSHPEMVQVVPEESVHCPTHYATALDQPGKRCPIAHPRYKLGDAACDEDMIVFPTSRQRRGRTRRRETNNDSDETLQSSSGSDSILCESSFDIHLAIGQLRHLDAAFSE